MEKFVVVKDEDFRYWPGEYFNYWIDDSYYKLDKFGGSDSRTFKDFFKQFCEECFKTNVDMAYDTKICPGFQVLRSEDSAYAIIIGSIEYSVDYYTARDIESEEDYFIENDLYFNKSELCLNNKKKNNSAESDVQQNHEQNHKDKRFLELFVFNIRNGFKVMVVAKRIWENIYTKKPAKRNEHIKACIEQAKWYKENCKCLFYNDEKAGRLCSRFGRERTQNTNDLCRVSKGAGRGFYQDTSWLSCFGKGYPQRKSAYHPVKRRFSGIFRTAQRGDNREIPQKAANYR